MTYQDQGGSVEQDKKKWRDDYTAEGVDRWWEETE